MAFMAAIAPIISVVGTLVSAVGAVRQGQEQQAAADYSAASARQAAGENEAAGTARSAEDIRKQNLQMSAAAAGAAASGVNPGFGSPVTLQGNIAKQGRYNALMDVYNGQVQGTSLENQARADEFAGQNAATAGYWNAGSALIGGADTLYSKYGGSTYSTSSADYSGGSTGRSAALGAQGYA